MEVIRELRLQMIYCSFRNGSLNVARGKVIKNGRGKYTTDPTWISPLPFMIQLAFLVSVFCNVQGLLLTLILGYLVLVLLRKGNTTLR